MNRIKKLYKHCYQLKEQEIPEKKEIEFEKYRKYFDFEQTMIELRCFNLFDHF